MQPAIPSAGLVGKQNAQIWTASPLTGTGLGSHQRGIAAR